MNSRSSIIRDIAINSVISMLEGRSGKSHQIRKSLDRTVCEGLCRKPEGEKGFWVLRLSTEVAL